MKVREIVEGMANKSVTRAELAEKYSITTRTVTNILKKNGFIWNQSESKHDFVGDAGEYESIMETDFQELLYNPQNQAPRKPRATSKPNTKEAVKSSPEAKNKPKDGFEESLVDIDALLFKSGEEDVKRFRGFYLQESVIKALDSNVKDGDKSKLVNDLLKALFKSRGLM